MKASLEIAKITQAAGKLDAMIKQLDELQHEMEAPCCERDTDGDLKIKEYARRITDILGAFDE